MAKRISILKSKKIALVAGGAGFIGSHLVKRLISEEYKVRLIDTEPALFVEDLGGVLNDSNLSIDQVDIVSLQADNKIFSGVDEYFQCIVSGNHRHSLVEPEPHFSPNLIPTIRIIEAARINSGVRVHHMSSSAVYGNASGKIHEDIQCEANTAYGLVKIFQEQAVSYWHRTYQIPSIIYRPFLCYGNGDSSGGVIDIFLQKIRKGQPLTLSGKGEAGRDFVHVNDVVDALIMVSKTNIKKAVYNIGSGQLTTIKQLANLMRGKIEYTNPRAIDISAYANVKRIRKDLNWRAKIPLEEGIANILKDLKQD